jgi:hypothetical protein
MCTHNIKISGNLSQVKAARRFLKKNGFMDRCIDRGFPLNGRWQTDHGLHVIVERKLVRWSSKRASRLIFRSADRSFCELSLYGETVQGQVVPEVGPGFPKTLKWSNGDTWQLLDGSCCAGEDMMFSQSMSKISRDATHDERYAWMLKLLWGLPAELACQCRLIVCAMSCSTLAARLVASKSNSKQNPAFVKEVLLLSWACPIGNHNVVLNMIGVICLMV